MAQQTDKLQWQNVKFQYLAAAVGKLGGKTHLSFRKMNSNTLNVFLFDFTVNLATISFGLFEGWSSPSIILLTSKESPLPSGSITMSEASWVASLQCIGCLFGNMTFGYIINRYGRRRPLILIAFPLAVCTEN